MKTLNFEQNKIQELDFQTLKQTYKENDVYGNPLRGIYHYQVINEVLERCERYGLKYNIQDMFAANNNSKQFPGVSILPQVEAQHGTGAPEAHILRRVYSTINIQDQEDDELTTNIAIAYHQDGVQVAFGTTVKICRNLTILGADQIVSNYGSGKLSNEQIFGSIDNWLMNFGDYKERDYRIINAMKNIETNKADVFRLIGMLTAIRVSFDNSLGDIRERLGNYPLNQAQISMFTENYLRETEMRGNDFLSLWDVYNLGTHIYKPATTEIPNIIPQTAVLFDVLNDTFKIF